MKIVIFKKSGSFGITQETKLKGLVSAHQTVAREFVAG